MNYSDFIDRLADTTGKSNAEAKELAEDVFSVLSQELSRGNGVSIPNLGTFGVKVNDVKKVYNPHYEKYMLVPPKRVVEFTPASGLKDELKFSGRGNE
ncbi:MAG: HU family DNA-binding protein [Balneolaceae bacterium]|nr:HU family DNA-binding protein [Balneolaceae bacterium]